MKTLFSMCILSAISLMGCGQSNNELEKVHQAVTDFVKGADERSVAKIENVLDDNFRAVVNRLFGSEEVSIMDKALYLKLLEQKKIGGDNREIEFIYSDITQNNALVKAQLSGKDLTFVTYVSLVQGSDGAWKVVSDQPYISKN